jgi:hypothetical protein
MKSVNEQMIDKWKELNIKSCSMEFSCGGDSMNDYTFTFYTNDNKEVDGEELTDYFETEVFNEVKFYEVSDGHYIGESGVVEIKLEEEDDEEPYFSYYKDASSEWSDRFFGQMNVPLTDTELSFIKEKVLNMNGGDWGEPNINYKVDCIVTDEEEKMMNDLIQKICDESEDFEIEDASGEPEEGFRWTTNEDEDEIKFEGNSLKVQVERNYMTTTPSE